MQCVKEDQTHRLTWYIVINNSIEPSLPPFICEIAEGKDVLFKDSRVVIDPNILLRITNKNSNTYSLVITIVNSS